MEGTSFPHTVEAEDHIDDFMDDGYDYDDAYEEAYDHWEDWN